MPNIGAFGARWRDALFEFGLPENRTARRSILLAGIALVVAAAIVRLWLADYSPWFDELASLYFAGLPTERLWGAQAVTETNPPLFYSLLAFWQAMGAQTVVELRTLPILAGIVSVALTGYIAARWFNPRAGIVAIVLMGLSAQHIYYSHMLRAYILSLDGVLLSIIGLLMIVDPRQKWDRKAGWSLHVAGCSIAIHCHTTMFLWPAIAALAFVVFWGRQLFADRVRLLVGLVAANFAILAVGSWWLWMTVLQLRSGAETIAWLKPIGLRAYLREIMETCMLTFDHYGRDKLATNWFAVLTIAASVVLWRDRAGRFIVLLALAAVVVFGVAGALKPILMPRTTFWLSIFPVLLIAGGVGALRATAARWAMVAVCAALLVVNLAREAPLFEQTDWPELIAPLTLDRNAVLVVQGASVGVRIRAICLLQLRQPCPFPVVVLPVDPGTRGENAWAKGSLDETPLSELRNRIRADSQLYAVRWGGDDPLRVLGIAGGTRPGDGQKPRLEGPFPAGVVLAGQR